jgi:hypothetical protein
LRRRLRRWSAAQRRLLSAAGVSLPWRTVSGVVFASTGLARVMPAGPVAGAPGRPRSPLLRRRHARSVQDAILQRP